MHPLPSLLLIDGIKQPWLSYEIENLVKIVLCQRKITTYSYHEYKLLHLPSCWVLLVMDDLLLWPSIVLCSRENPDRLNLFWTHIRYLPPFYPIAIQLQPDSSLLEGRSHLVPVPSRTMNSIGRSRRDPRKMMVAVGDG